jgi:hypothetical protein
MSNATLLIKVKKVYANGVIVERRVYELAEPNADAPHGYSYRLHCGTRTGQTLVRFDNETGKGDHVHWGDTEQPYAFTTLDQLLDDFIAAIQPHIRS